MNTEKAKEFAEKAHRGQIRKSSQTKTPYIEHPIRVAETLKLAGFSDEVVMAGYLHDTIEDTWVTAEDIEAEFGSEVLQLVLSNTENKQHSWEARKQHTIDAVALAPLEVKALVVADKLDNLSSMIGEFNQVGDELWSIFHRGKEKQGWYYKGISENCLHGLEPDQVPGYFYIYQEKAEEFFA